LQEKTFLRVGGTEEIPIDIRIIAATNKDPKREIAQGSFRQDLYYRLNVIALHVPPLAERRNDIPLLCYHFLQKFSQAQGKKINHINDDVMQTLLGYEFPGNIRELENIIERAVALVEESTIEVQHLPIDLQQVKFIRLQNKQQSQKLLTLEENEKEYIMWVLDQANDNKTKAAEILGIDRVSLWRKLKRYEGEDEV